MVCSCFNEKFSFVTPGINTCALSVRNESVADVLESATQYAAHQLGGILRKVALFESILKPQGAEYRVAGEFALK